MPRNRRPQDREEKRAEIVVAATALFTESGYDETPMSKVAAAAGVTTNTIYWYFTDKDSLLVAVLDHVLGSALGEAALESDRPWVDQVLWAVDRLTHYRRLVTVVHARTATSPPIDTWHNNFHALVDTLLIDGFRRAGVPEPDLGPMAAIGVFVVEGLLMHPHAEPDRRAIVQALMPPRT
ncbi:TetR/AcrR family transcriptional regulator [Nocardioides sp.]|uniref:TetR/AcrR family transcriptional regulator n=1 Tax=Nocardioides sp. TaxID=35761 RepID=UPI0027339075|nr:TetR/AcrR family transcriptional regulator [Nocardioides sp.]MDP3893756.1 TetR/AcrR family transcriptional regulator [Nocardioides sp.]